MEKSPVDRPGPPDQVDLEALPPKQSAAALRALYLEHGDAKRRAAARQGLWLAVIVYVSYCFLDVLLIPDVALSTSLTRLFVGACSLVVFEILYRKDSSILSLEMTCAAALIGGYVMWLVPAVTTSYHANFAYFLFFGTTFMMGANLFFGFEFRLSLIASGIILAASLIALWMFPASTDYRITLAAFNISCFTFTSYVNWKLNRERYKVFLNALAAKNEHKQATERGNALLRLSRTDPLTGLANRRAIDEKLWSLWQNWQQNGESFAALLIDVDFFKKYNDFYGHQEGDNCLVVVAKALSEAIRDFGATIGRYGGEEFIILASMSDAKEVEAFADSVRRTVEDLALPHRHRRDGISIVTVSVGAALSRELSSAKLERIIHEADRALYLAKANGRNCIHLFDANDPQSNDESENIAALLRIAIDEKLISMVYQPIQDVATGNIEAVEALMRLKMLDGTSVPPSVFIPVAERTGAIIELGRWALRKVCKDLLADNHVPVVSVNVSPMQLRAPGFAASVATILGENGIVGSRLALEITEGLEMEMHSDVLRCIKDLKLLGVRIWLDDFGTGFAGLSWLRLIEFDTVKIDRSFLHDSVTSKGRGMLLDIISLIRNHGHKILVEGVESAEQMKLMCDFGIDHVQGYHIGRPVPPKLLLPHLTAYKPKVAGRKSA